MHWIRPHLALAPFAGRFARVRLFGPDDPGRDDVEAFIAAVYHARYQAQLTSFLPHLLAYHDAQGQLVAAVGLRAGDEGRLFVEQYLDAPVEDAMARRGLARLERARMVEVGNFAAITPGVARELIVHVTWMLAAAQRHWVLFVATQQLRNAFRRLQLSLVELAPADATCLDDPESDWGDYYATCPRLMCGNVAEGGAFLRRERERERERDAEAAWLPIRQLAVAS